jgi:hypothetical protein
MKSTDTIQSSTERMMALVSDPFPPESNVSVWRSVMWKQVVAVGAVLLLVPSLFSGASDSAPPQPVVIKLDMPPPHESEGGVIVADVDNDGAMDYLVAVPGHLAVYANTRTLNRTHVPTTSGSGRTGTTGV